MEAPGMTDDEVRDLFSAYHDRELSAAQHDQVAKALEASPDLAKEYASFCALLVGLSSLAGPQDAEAAPAHTLPDEGARIDLLAGVQNRLNKRSAGIFPLEVLAAVVLLGLVLAYFAMTAVTIESAPDHTAPAAPSR